MKRYLILLFICSILSIHANAHKSPGIAVYNVDSVMVILPEYKEVLDAYIQFDSLLNSMDLQIEKEYRQKINEFNNDSTKWSPMIREIKRKEITDLGENIREFREQAYIEREEKKRSLRSPLERKIAEAAAIIGKEKGFLAVICNGGYNERQRRIFFDGLNQPVQNIPTLLNETISQPAAYQDPTIKTVNITTLLIEKLK